MRAALLLLLCAGCFPPAAPPDCTTAGGVDVYGVGDCAELSRAQGIVEQVTGARFPPGWRIQVLELQPGEFEHTSCDTVWTSVRRTESLAQGGFFHEAMHVFDDCASSCAVGGPWDVPGGKRDQWVAAAQMYQAGWTVDPRPEVAP